ncbi:hypothetical protein SODALDRAFT_312840 [Sodiomyces alkalinus F11]|uniref:Acyltransferase MbtK/IucB-like conserved domain-containing protein n=1 Tax=Sodiomyces alkalinus (strain CBS 110278 / VKM F-3762 / F11) TaxID=1314773 RepID=A0A3N2PUW2_SODAK|nr:hypothetical protein SODALDRAFT_312840 [Sodiomyces alkalinus F11]ROT38264.1 hypothetical protein SODALDRAFT_312840 [Sodiomyces alkalinus F11]
MATPTATSVTMSPPYMLRLPDGQNFTVTPVFAGLFFKSHKLNTHPNAFPIGWTVVLNTEEGNRDDSVDAASHHPGTGEAQDRSQEENQTRPHRRRINPYKKPTLQNDNLFISTTSTPSNSEYRPAASPSRQIAMMLWITLYWYFHQPEPAPYLTTETSKNTPENARPKGEWRINIKREGVLRGRNLIPKLERMGLVASFHSAVGTSVDDSGREWSRIFVSRRMFWQVPGRLFLFSLKRNSNSSFPGSPPGSRPVSPSRNDPIRPVSYHPSRSSSPAAISAATSADLDVYGAWAPAPTVLLQSLTIPTGPFDSTSHLPTYYPPGPLVYTMTGGIRHPLRPKPPRMGEVFYTRFVPSAGQYLSFRVASVAPQPVPYLGPVGPSPPEKLHSATLSDTSLLQAWMSIPRVSAFWGSYHPQFLADALDSQHSFPAIGMWDGVPFGYFEIYWVKEDVLGRHLGGGSVGDWDRGIHFFVGEEWARGRPAAWTSSLVHWCFTTDYRTMNVCAEPRIDNTRGE